MTLLLRKSSAQARIEGWDSGNWPDDDYAVVDDTIVGRIYREMILGKPKWLWFIGNVDRRYPCDSATCLAGQSFIIRSRCAGCQWTGAPLPS
jgi:hypothetical protein